MTYTRKKSARTSRDRAKTSTAKVANKPWIWLLSGVLIGLMIAVILNRWDRWENQIAQAKSRQIAKTNKNATSQNTNVQFDFYHVLPKLEAKQQKKSPSNNESTTSKTHKSNSTYLYVLQAGSFQKQHDADELKAALALQGFNATIESTVFSNGQKWHRVMLGPFNSRQGAIKYQQQLEAQKIHGTLLVKRNK